MKLIGILRYQFHAERELNSSLVGELEQSRNEVESLSAENSRLKTEIRRLEEGRLRNMYYNDDEDSENSDDESVEPVEDYLALKMKATQAEVAALLK